MPVVFKQLDELRCDLVAHTYLNDIDGSTGTDAEFMPVSAARVSHGREDKTGEDVEKDKKLMKYLADHKHMSPFEHQSATFLVECPLFVAREWHRHRTQSYNEISRRYTSDDIVFYMPDALRAQAKSNRQASDGTVEGYESLWQFDNWREDWSSHHDEAFGLYTHMIESGVAREVARMVLPVSLLTRFYATANLRNWAHFYSLRSSPDAQLEIRHFAEKIDQHLTALWSGAWGVLKEANAKEESKTG